MSDDWARFCAMMAADDWVLADYPLRFCWKGQEYPRYYPSWGAVVTTEKSGPVALGRDGNWRKWLEAGQTPPPF